MRNTHRKDEDYATFQKRADRLIDYMGSMTVNESGKNYNGKLPY